MTPTQSFFLELKPPMDSTGRPNPSWDFPALSPAVGCRCSGTTRAPIKGSAALSQGLIHYTILRLLLPTEETLVNKGQAVICGWAAGAPATHKLEQTQVSKLFHTHLCLICTSLHPIQSQEAETYVPQKLYFHSNYRNKIVPSNFPLYFMRIYTAQGKMH